MSTAAFSAASAYTLIPNREEVTLSLRVSYKTDQVKAYDIEDAKRVVQSNGEAEPSDAIYVRRRLSWWLPAVQVQAALPDSSAGLPRPGDQITDGDNVIWTIQDVGNPALGAWWKCRCVSLVLEDLQQRLTIKTASNATDANASSLTPQSPASPILCAIQEVLDASVEYQGIDSFMRYFKIWTFSDDYLPKGTIVTDGDGQSYEVLRVSDKKRIDSLMLIEAVIQP